MNRKLSGQWKMTEEKAKMHEIIRVFIQSHGFKGDGGGKMAGLKAGSGLAESGARWSEA